MIKLYDRWKPAVISGYTTDNDGKYGNNLTEDVSNYRMLADRFGIDVNSMVRVSQKHTDNILVATKDNGGDGIIRDNISEAEDAIVTNEKNLMICIVTADCVPVFLYDEKTKAIGLSHCSRVGITKNMPAKTVMKMVEQFGTRPEDISVILGPYLSQKHHEVEAKDIDMFKEFFSKDEIERFVISKGDKFYVDMGEATGISLSRTGVTRDKIMDERVCTYDNAELYSWRRDHDPRRRILSFMSTTLC